MPRATVARLIFVLAAAAGVPPTYAQQMPASAQPAGTLVIVPAYGEVRQPNDEVRATFMVEEQDKDKAAAASRVNLRMKQGTELLRRADPAAVLQTRGYYTYPVYADEPAHPRQAPKAPQPVGWRVGQYLEMKTGSLDKLPAVVAGAQKLLALNGLQFGLSEASARKLEEQRISAAYQNLQEKIVAIAKAMGRNPSDAVLETIDFEGSGNYAPQAERMLKPMSAGAAEAVVEEPSFEPGETALGSRLVGRIRFR